MLRNTRRILICFELVSGLRINYSKSCLYMVRKDDSVLQNAALSFGCKCGDFPFSYLGIQLGANPAKVKTWKPIIDKFKLRLSGWKKKLLSFGGRLTLVR